MKPHMYLLNKYWEPTIVYPEEMKEGPYRDWETLRDWETWETCFQSRYRYGNYGNKNTKAK